MAIGSDSGSLNILTDPQGLCQYLCPMLLPGRITDQVIADL